MADAVGVDLGPQPLGDHVDEVVLEVLGHPRDEGHAHRRPQQQAHPAEELAGRVLRVARRVLVDDVAEDQRVEQREDLVDRGQHEGQRDQAPVPAQVRVEQPHRRPAGARGGNDIHRATIAAGGMGDVFSLNSHAGYRFRRGHSRPRQRPPRAAHRGRRQPGAGRFPRLRHRRRPERRARDRRHRRGKGLRRQVVDRGLRGRRPFRHRLRLFRRHGDRDRGPDTR